MRCVGGSRAACDSERDRERGGELPVSAAKVLGRQRVLSLGCAC